QEYNPVVCSSILLHRSLLEKVKGFPEEPSCKGVEDYALWLRICSLRTIAYIDEPLVTYMDDAKNSVRGEVTNNFYEQRIQLFKNFLSWSPKGSTYDTIVKNLLAKTKIMFIYSLLKLSIKNLIKK
ncbi:MAG: hypothetical protein N2376_06885, partial [Clostridia bacterium]|nr:hypothetical protein [Clostridia bacterium]